VLAGSSEDGTHPPTPRPHLSPHSSRRATCRRTASGSRSRSRAVAVAKAVAWEHEREVPRALVEYPSVGTVREVRLTTRKKAAYRRALRAARAIDGPPARVDDDRCSGCEYRETCGVGRRSFRSLLG